MLRNIDTTNGPKSRKRKARGNFGRRGDNRGAGLVTPRGRPVAIKKQGSIAVDRSPPKNEKSRREEYRRWSSSLIVSHAVGTNRLGDTVMTKTSHEDRRQFWSESIRRPRLRGPSIARFCQQSGVSHNGCSAPERQLDVRELNPVGGMAGFDPPPTASDPAGGMAGFGAPAFCSSVGSWPTKQRCVLRSSVPATLQSYIPTGRQTV